MGISIGNGLYVELADLHRNYMRVVHITQFPTVFRMLFLAPLGSSPDIRSSCIVNETSLLNVLVTRLTVELSINLTMRDMVEFTGFLFPSAFNYDFGLGLAVPVRERPSLLARVLLPYLRFGCPQKSSICISWRTCCSHCAHFKDAMSCLLSG